LGHTDYSRKNIDLEHMTVAAIDESYLAPGKNMACMTVVCSIPTGLSKHPIKKRKEITRLLIDPNAHDYLIAQMLLPRWSNNHEKMDYWIKGVWQGIAFVDATLQSLGKSKIDVAYVDGEEPRTFRDCEIANGTEVRFESKGGTRTYGTNADSRAIQLLKLSDRIVRRTMHTISGEANLELLATKLESTKMPFITLAPYLPAIGLCPTLENKMYDPFNRKNS
jgi:hypothetical protein